MKFLSFWTLYFQCFCFEKNPCYGEYGFPVPEGHHERKAQGCPTSFFSIFNPSFESKVWGVEPMVRVRKKNLTPMSMCLT